MAASPSAALLLPLLGGGEQLACLCDVKQAGGQSYFRLSEERVLAWLRLKVDQAKAALQASAAAAFRCCRLPDCFAGQCNPVLCSLAALRCHPFMLSHDVPAVPMLCSCCAAAWTTWASPPMRQACWGSTSPRPGKTSWLRWVTESGRCSHAWNRLLLPGCV